MWFLSALTATFVSLVSLAAAEDLPKIEVVGNKFFYSNNGSQFLIRGVAYQQNPMNTTGESQDKYVDPLADAEACKRDVKYLADAKTNVLRVYAVDPTKDHDECMKTFADAGIYIIADLSSPAESINRDSPAWDVNLYKRYTSVVDMFANYSNVLGFFAGNEVTNNRSNTDASPFVKAAVRDMKAYIKEKGWHYPVGYSSNDDAEIRTAIGDYFACGDDDAKADFFGVNMYEWCGDSSFEKSGYEAQTKLYKNMTIPVFMSEYGCNRVKPRKFQEIGTIFSDKMTDVWSGGIVYMYFEEANKYGLVSTDGNSVSTMTDYSYYSEQMNKISPNLAKSDDVSVDKSKTFECPASAKTWEASPSLPPTPDEGICDCIQKSLKCVVSDDVDEDDYGELFGEVCGKLDSCDAVSVNGKNGTYGAVSFCSNKEKLSYIINQYYESQDGDKSACDFDGSASLAKSSNSESSCQAVVSSVSAHAQVTGSTSGASGAANVGSGSGSSGSGSSGSSEASSSSSSSKKSSGHISARVISKGELLAVGAMVMCFVGGFTTFFM
ncbi:hypothetical protein CJJ07_000645 [Candidozyma auris]|nr:hypothetical protein CJJ07_000645 [[Candida] auris]QEL60759.1 hypothetical protein CJJ09_002877 [[Candida] auris]